MRDLAEDLSDRALAWVVRRQAMRIRNHHAALQMLKNTAYAWRQAIFFLSFRDRAGQEAAVMRLWELVDRANLDDRFGPAADGLAHVVAGGRFEADGRVNGQRARRFLGWSVGPHWCLPRDLARLSASR